VLDNKECSNEILDKISGSLESVKKQESHFINRMQELKFFVDKFSGEISKIENYLLVLEGKKQVLNELLKNEPIL
jgi:hypothetical protein